MKKRVISLVILLAMTLLTVMASALETGYATVSMGSVSVKPGEVVEIKIEISDNPGLASWMFDLTWDTSAFILDAPLDQSVSVGEAFSGGIFLSKKTDNGVRVSWYNANDVASEGVMFSLTLLAKTEKTGQYEVGIECSEVNTINVAEETVTVRTANGTITVYNDSDPADQSESDVPPSSTPSETVPDDWDQTEDTSSATDDQPNDVFQGDSTDHGSDYLPFDDVKMTEYFYDAVIWAVAERITTGTTAATFSPHSPCTRAQVVTFLWRAAGSPEISSTTATYDDVEDGSYYEAAVRWAVAEGITTGTTETTFSPHSPCTRAQVVTFLWRAAGCPLIENGSIPFSDVPDGSYSQTAVCWAASMGITAGKTAISFAPDDTCTRAQVMTFIYRAK